MLLFVVVVVVHCSLRTSRTPTPPQNGPVQGRYTSAFNATLRLYSNGISTVAKANSPTAASAKQPPKVEEVEVPLPSSKDAPPSPIRITLASLDEYNSLLQNGLDFYGATFFPTESNLPQLTAAKIATRRGR